MNWTQPVWLYCERGTSTALWAEPANAASNVAFLLAAIGGIVIYRRLAANARSADHVLMIVLTLLIGAGSLLFHLFANAWSELADIVPIYLFMLVYLGFALNRFLLVPPGWTVLLTGAFAAANVAAATMICPAFDNLVLPGSVSQDAVHPATSCLNGSGAYLPAFVALFVIALLLAKRRQKAAWSLFVASLLFLISLAVRTVDHLYCHEFVFEGQALGTHFVWHLLNGLVVFILLRAAMRHQVLPTVQEIIPPGPRDSVAGE